MAGNNVLSVLVAMLGIFWVFRVGIVEACSANTAQQLECVVCHYQDRPSKKHYVIYSCEICHSKGDWQIIHFEHSEHNNCGTCHERPRNHRTGPCIFCHDTVDWWSAS